MSTLRTTSRTIEKDSVLIPIEYIRVANLALTERDKLEQELAICTRINRINANLNLFSDSVTKKLEQKIYNLEAIVLTKDDIIGIERDKYKESEKKHRRDKLKIIGGAILLITASILL